MANNVLEFYIKLKDMMSSGLAKIAKAGKEGLRSVANSAKEVQHFINQGANAVGRFASSSSTATSRVVQNNRVVGGSYKSLLQEIDNVKRKIQESGDGKIIAFNKNRLRALNIAAANHAGNLNPATTPAPNSSMFSGIASYLIKRLAPIAIATSAFSFATSSAKAAMDFGATKESFSVLTGSRKRGAELANELNYLKQNTIMGSAVYKSAQTMMGFGISDKKVIEYQKMLGNVAMGNKERFDSLTLAFSQTQAAGKLMGQDLLQYINAGFNPLQTISEKWEEFGFKQKVSVGELKEMVEKGKISADMVVKSFELATSSGGKFNGMMDAIAKTSFGKMQIMQGKWANLQIEVGNALTPLTDGILELSIKTLDWLNVTKKQSEALSIEQSEVQILVQKIVALNEGNETRKNLLNELIVKYPELFGHIDKEKIANTEILSILEKVNKSYEERIKLAANVYALDESVNEQNKNQSHADKLLQIAYLLKTGHVDSAKKLNEWGYSVQGAKIRDDWSNEQNASKFEELAKKYQSAADSWNSDIKVQKSIIYAQEAKPIANEIIKLINDSPARKDFFKEFKNPDYSEKEFVKAYESQIKNSDKFKVDWKGFKSKYMTAGGILNPASTTTKEDTDNVSKSVVSGGPRVININGVTLKFADKIDIAAKDPEDLINKAEPEIKSMWLRVLNSGAKMQG